MSNPATNSDSLQRRATTFTVSVVFFSLLLAGIVLIVLFIRVQVENSHTAASTTAKVASSTVAAAIRFGGRDVISDALRVFESGSNHDSVALYDGSGALIAQLIAPGEASFPSTLLAGSQPTIGMLEAPPVFVELADTYANTSAPVATMVVKPHQGALRETFHRAVLALAVVLAIAALLSVLVAQQLSKALLRPVRELTEWVDVVSESFDVTRISQMPSTRTEEVRRLAASIEALFSQIHQQNSELKHKQYELRAINKHLEHLAFSDALTGLPNRALFEEQLKREIEHAEGAGSSFALLFIDMDQLKQINDLQGHASGDAALRATANRLRQALSETDFVTRLAGDEFMVISPKVQTNEDATKLGAQLNERLQEVAEGDSWRYPVQASIGIAMYPQNGRSVTELVHAADVSMYRAKLSGNQAKD